MFIKYNANPKQKTTDCALRAVCKALNKDWQTAYFDLCKLGSQLWCMPNDDKAIEEYLRQHGFVRKTYKVKAGDTRITVKEFANHYNKGAYVLRIASHLTCVVDGNIYDLWDTSSKCVYSYYVKAL